METPKYNIWEENDILKLKIIFFLFIVPSIIIGGILNIGKSIEYSQAKEASELADYCEWFRELYSSDKESVEIPDRCL